MQCLTFVQGKVYKAEVVGQDTTTYLGKLLVCRLLNLASTFPPFDLGPGQYTGEKVAIFEHGDKFMEYC